MKHMFRWSLVAFLILASARPAAAQTTQSDDWKIAIYPVFAWIPISIDIDVNVPPVSGGGGSGPEFGGKIVDGRLDGAFFGGLSAAKGNWRIDADGLWAGGGRRSCSNVRSCGSMSTRSTSTPPAATRSTRISMPPSACAAWRSKYDIELAGRQFERKPGLWDPLVGVGWHHGAATSLDLHVTFEGGGFGVGADVDIGTAVRLDWKPTTHFGIAAGYSLLYFKLSNTVGDRTFTAKQTLHGPVVGIGLYF